MCNRGSGFVALALMLTLMVNQVSHSQSEAAEAAMAAPVPATNAPHANKNNTKVFAEGGMGVDVAAATGGTSSPNEDNGKKPGAPSPEPKEVKFNQKENKNVTIINKPQATPSQLPNGKMPIDRVHLDDMNIPGQAFFYVLVGITSTAIVLLVLRVYRLRLSRAERKYGVQGDRANQELTPLPMAIEDVNSDEEDHTVFEVNRQNIRIL